MKTLLTKINDPRLNCLVERLDNITDGVELQNKFKLILEEYQEYDSTFLWVLCYHHENIPLVNKYIEENYKKFHQYLDSGFPKKIAKKSKFDSHMWEMLLLDMLSSTGKLIQKKEGGADILLELKSGQLVQVEAIVPEEAEDTTLHSIKPNYSKSDMFELSGNIEDLERPILLRFVNAFDDKAKTTYEKDKPLIIAINTSKVVGTISRDDYIIKRILFGLGADTITKKSDGSYVKGLEQKSSLKKPHKEDFLVGRFRDSKYKHVSGVIYTSQSPIGLVPGRWGWSNHGITYVPNPLATHKVDLDLGFFRKIICNEEIYQETDAEQDFVSNVL